MEKDTLRRPGQHTAEPWRVGVRAGISIVHGVSARAVLPELQRRISEMQIGPGRALCAQHLADSCATFAMNLETY